MRITTGLVHHLENKGSYHPERKKLYLLLPLSDGRARLSTAPLHLVQQQTISSCFSNLWLVEMVMARCFSLFEDSRKVSKSNLSWTIYCNSAGMPTSDGISTTQWLKCLTQLNWNINLTFSRNISDSAAQLKCSLGINWSVYLNQPELNYSVEIFPRNQLELFTSTSQLILTN